ncbi:MAG: hypothetical protein EB060_06275 [Proteobacteria bacterium]|nr:hypothetical protein [Pseudomonadota bacterium]
MTLNKVTLNKVKIDLENFEGGSPSWNFSEGRPAADVEQGKQVVADYFGIKGVVIKEGTLIFRSGDKANPKVKQLDLSEVSIDASSLSGPFKIKGGLKSDELNFSFESEVGNLARAEPADVTFSLISGSSRMDVKGEVSNWLTTPTVKGEVTANIDRSIDSLLDYFGINRALLPKAVSTVLSNKTTEVKGNLFLSSAGFNLSDVTINSVSTKGSGSVGVTFGNLVEVNVKLAFDNLDIDKLMEEPAPEPAAPNAAPKEVKKPTVDLKEFGKEAATPAEPQFDLAQNLKFMLGLDIKKAKFRGQEVTDVQLEMDMGQGATMIRKLSAKNLPGESVIDVSGKVFEANEAMGQSQRFDSVISATGKDLIPMIRWLQVDFPEIKPGKMKDYDFNAKITFTKERTTVSEVKLAIDDTYVIGQAVVVKGEVPVANSAFKVGRINLDDYLVSSDPTAAIEGFWDRLLTDQELAQQQRKFDVLRHIDFSFFKNLGISIAADELIYKGGNYKNFVVVGVLKPNALDVRSLEFESSFTGKVKGSGFLNTSGLVPQIEANLAFDKFDIRNLRDFKPAEAYDPKTKPVWSEKNFFLGKLGIANTKIALKFGELDVGRLKFTEVETGGTIDSEMIQVPSFRGKLYGGLLDMKGNMSIGRQVLNVSFSVANASLPQSLHDIMGIDAITEGRYSASGSIQTAGTNVKALLAGVSGTGTMAARGLVLKGADFSKISTMRFDKPLEEVNRIVYEALAGGQTSIDYVASSMTAKDGLVDLQNLTITTSAVDRSAVSAQISLPAWQADVNGSVIYGLKYPIGGTNIGMYTTVDIPLGLKISGPLNDLRPEWDKSAVAVKWRERRFGQ